MRVLTIAGSLRDGSFNKMLLRAALRSAPPGTTVTEWDRLAAIPPFSEDDEHVTPPEVGTLYAAISEADAVLVATPEYNGSIPGQLKNALDWASRPFPDNVLRGKPLAVVGTSPSPAGAARSQTEAREVLRRIGAQVVDRHVAMASAHEHFDGDGRLTDPAARAGLEQTLKELVAAAAQPDRPA